MKANASGCDAAAIAAPCFDIGSTFAASHSATMVSASPTITVTGGLSAHDRPFVVGQALSCAGCTTGRFITSIDVPPTAIASRAGQIGKPFSITARQVWVSTTETVTAGCSGPLGAGSNCIDVAIQINTTNGTYGTAAALATCGENNLNGNAPPYNPPSGVCQSNGVGSLVRSVRIGTAQSMSGGVSGSVWDDGLDITGGFTQNSAFTCNIVAAKIMQCVKGAAYTTGVASRTMVDPAQPSLNTVTLLSEPDALRPSWVRRRAIRSFTAGSGYPADGTFPVFPSPSARLVIVSR